MLRYKLPTALALLAFLPSLSYATFDTGFVSFINQNYPSFASQLIRTDLGTNGSFGGNTVDKDLRLYRDPIIFVHGLNANASSLIQVRDFFSGVGFAIGELYATSYGPNKTTVDASSTLQCSYIKQLRQLIAAVEAYTKGKKVVIVAYSIGAAIARKAILGGKCVDTKEDLGSSLKDQVSVFLSVAGSNLGATECNTYPTSAICTAPASLKTNSDFLKDINSQQGYEGQARYSIGSKTDDIVGFANLSLPGAQINVTFDNYNHGDTLLNTLNTQVSLILYGYASQRTVNKDAYAESKLSGKNCTGTVSNDASSVVGPHDSKSQLSGNNDDESMPGEYNRQSKIYTFLSGFNYTRHLDPTKGKFFGIRNSPSKSG